MTVLGIIGGTGLSKLAELENVRRQAIRTPYGEPSSPLTHGTLYGIEVVFLARHGYGHTIPPHRVNYRANLWALREASADTVLAIAAVGSIHPELEPGGLAFPDQIIDYTSGRSSTYYEEDLEEVIHVDFTYPYSESLRVPLMRAARSAQLNAMEGGVYGCMQGPRLETAAEIQKLKRDGCDMVGMTGMPEAALARELNLQYACCAVVANWAAGLSGSLITIKEIEKHVSVGMDKVANLLHCVSDEINL